MRAQFVLSEIGVGLRRNLTMTIAVIVSVALSLALAGAAILLRTQVNQMGGYWGNKVEVSIYFCNKDNTKDPQFPNCEKTGQVTQAQMDAVQSQLNKSGLVEKLYTETPAMALSRYKPQNPTLAALLTPQYFNYSFRVKLKDPEQYTVVANQVSGMPAVKVVDDENQLLKPLFKLLNGAQVVALVVMAIMLAVALLLIVNTVRVSAFSRRRETGIMRLVGASNYYVQMPFIAEAAFAATVGAALASGMLALGKYVLIDHFLNGQVAGTTFIGWSPVVKVFPLLVVIGLGMSSIAAFLTLRKYLKV